MSSVAKVVEANKKGIWDISRLEVLGGQFRIELGGPGLNHYYVSENIGEIFRKYFEGKGCKAREVFDGKVGVFLTDRDMTIPDIVIIGDEAVTTNWGIFGSPDLVVEVSAPDTSELDRGYKKDLYEKCGVKEYWVIDPAQELVEIYVLKGGKYNLNSEIKTSLFDDLDISVNEIFVGIDDFV